MLCSCYTDRILWLLGCVLALLALGSVPVSAHYLTCAEEREVGQRAVQEYERRYDIYPAPRQLQEIRARLIECNPNRGLLTSGGQRTRYMVPLKVTADPQVNAFCFPAGHIYVSQQMIDFCNTRDSDGYTNLRNSQKNCFYNNGTLAFVVGHEMGHFVNADYLREYDKKYRWNFLLTAFQMQAKSPEAVVLSQQVHNLVDKLTTRDLSFKTEKQADEKGWEFVENVPEYSLGNAAIFFRRLGNLEALNNTKDNWQRPHSKTELRYRRTLSRMRRISGGRVKIKEGKFYLDGKLFLGTGLMPAKNQVDAFDRTLYVAGQVAAAIEQGCWNKDSVVVAANDGWAAGTSKKQLAIFAGKSLGTQISIRKVIDVFDLTDAVDTNRLTRHQQEELDALRELVNSAKKSK